MIQATRYRVTVTYTVTGVTKSYTGAFSAETSVDALRKGRDFVVRYLRPSSILSAGLAADLP